ncbi:MOSC domain protein [Aspergillus clavatus NRRL 1]|uniref:MOSC domain protein n=1 Tax=Aspergillus clavatus (strain ATCC 1007 / CBS 513.65 / DSM 816 / NCTC 3887 / NRRL 1 / QM 1276 / 107) TaxID=344612 RepID=A1CSK8_ASPCL|nr:MOSC domain protein [Aspergillus clavatus NRRL 1]EAW06295.1 MOSC domain protein [Aspergillus clavatus NRRL 1]
MQISQVRQNHPSTLPSLKSITNKQHHPQLYVYPIKSLRGIPLSKASLTRTGFHHDRRFMLLKATQGEADDTPTLKNMHVPHFPEMALFTTEFIYPDGDDAPDRILVTYHPPDPTSEKHSLEIPLHPSTHGLRALNIDMHRSPTQAYDMGTAYNDWFSARFGYDVVLAYLGGHARPVLGTFAPGKHRAHRAEKLASGRASLEGVLSTRALVVLAAVTLLLNFAAGLGPGAKVHWASSLAATAVAGVVSYALVWRLRRVDEEGEGDGDGDEETITFADAAPYLLTSQTSLDNVSARLAGDARADMTKFRPNIVVSGAAGAFEEDFWAVLTVGDAEAKVKAKLLLTANCVRCQSVNVDYATGKMGTGEAGTVLKKLMNDRRVDTGAKYSPVFGRYVFLDPGSENSVVRVGDAVEVVRRMKERAVFGEI